MYDSYEEALSSSPSSSFVAVGAGMSMMKETVGNVMRWLSESSTTTTTTTTTTGTTGGGTGGGSNGGGGQTNITTTIIGNETVVIFGNETAALVEQEEKHEHDALSTFYLNVTIIGCLLLAYYVKKFRIYYLPESAGALLVGVVVGGIARLATDEYQLFEFSPEVFFFVLLPPIIFEAGYSLKKKDFFDNIGAITLYAMVGTIISTFVVGGLTFQAAQVGIVNNIDKHNPMEALLFGALISAVDPVATLSIMGSAELKCDPLLYSLVFGESVLNDAIAISLFNVFSKYYDPDGPDLTRSQIPSALLKFLIVSLFSVFVGFALGLAASFMYKHTTLSDFPHLETSLLFSFCYLCYSTAEAMGLSGIMALFFQGIVLSHYNSYNLSTTAHVASEQIFATLACIAETAVFLYMGMGVFTGRFQNFDVVFSVLALSLCILGRFLNIFPLSFIANLCRQGTEVIPYRMQFVLWFAGLRGAIAFALAVNMPGNHSEIYATTTLSICMFTTIVCGGLTDRMLTNFGMKQMVSTSDRGPPSSDGSISRSTSPPANRNRPHFSLTHRTSHRVYKGAKKLWKQLDRQVLRQYFGGSTSVQSAIDQNGDDHLGNYELGYQNSDSDDEDEELFEMELRRSNSSKDSNISVPSAGGVASRDLRDKEDTENLSHASNKKTTTLGSRPSAAAARTRSKSPKR